MPDYTIPKCLKTQLVHGSDIVTYLLPYDGILVESKFKQLAKRFAEAVAKLYAPNFTHQQVEDQLLKRLKSEWYTGREKDVTIEKDKFGTFTLHGENWHFYGWPERDFKVLA